VRSIGAAASCRERCSAANHLRYANIVGARAACADTPIDRGDASNGARRAWVHSKCAGSGQNPPGYRPQNVSSIRRSALILGVGTDLIEIERIQRSYERYGESFLLRVFTPGEIAYCMARKNYAESLAARFAAKEAGAKALGTGISRGVSWRELEVRRAPGQRPELHLSGRAAEVAARLGIRRLSLSLSHSREQSIAIVIAED